MQTSQSTTPYGRRPYSLALMETQIVAQSCPAETIAHKWQVLTTFGRPRTRFGLSDCSVAVLNALLSFHQETTLTGGEPIVVFPSNKSLAQRANGMAENSLRRYLGRLVFLGSSFVATARTENATRGERRRARSERPLASILVRSLRAPRNSRLGGRGSRRRAGSPRSPRPHHHLPPRHRQDDRHGPLRRGAGGLAGVFRSLRRSQQTCIEESNFGNAQAVADALERLAEEIRTALETHVKTTKMSGNDSQNEGHIQNSTQNPIPEFELVFRKRQGQLPSLSVNHRCRLSPSHSKIARNVASPCLWSSTLAPTLPSMRPTESTLGAI